MAPASEFLTIGQAATRTGLSVHTLRFYEKEGLFPAPVRRIAGQRMYSERDVEWLYLCTRLRASGMSLESIREYAALVRAGDSTVEERLSVLRRHREHVTAQIAELNHCLDLISHKVALYEERFAGESGDPLWNGAGLAKKQRPSLT